MDNFDWIFYTNYYKDLKKFNKEKALQHWNNYGKQEGRYCNSLLLYFPNNSFGEYRGAAINLLKNTIDILNEYNINYFLISGTLLGYVRHNDFIPWDDDIDLIVDKSIIDKLPEIYKKYNYSFLNIENHFIKICNKNSINVNRDDYNKYLLNQDDKYTWPFIDLFIYTIENNKILFFDKSWDIEHFFPANKVNFININVNIPINPDYFLKINFGYDYMTTIKSNSYCHKTETPINTIITLRNQIIKKSAYFI